MCVCVRDLCMCALQLPSCFNHLGILSNPEPQSTSIEEGIYGSYSVQLIRGSSPLVYKDQTYQLSYLHARQ